MPWKGDDRYIVCQECGAICKRFGWIERTLSAFVSRNNVCCACSDEEHYCSNCRKLLNRSGTVGSEKVITVINSGMY